MKAVASVAEFDKALENSLVVVDFNGKSFLKLLLFQVLNVYFLFSNLVWSLQAGCPKVR